MPKLLQINPVLRMNTSTGRIMQEIGDVAMSAGWESFVAYSKGRDGMRESTSKTVPVGNRFSVAVHGLGTRLFDRHGLLPTERPRLSSRRLRRLIRTSSTSTTFTVTF